jgi:hypothetical protein
VRRDFRVPLKTVAGWHFEARCFAWFDRRAVNESAHFMSTLAKYDIFTAVNMHIAHSSHETSPLPLGRTSRYIRLIKRVHEEPARTQGLKIMPITRSAYVSPALAGERRTVRHSVGSLRQLEVETAKAIGASRADRR